MADLALARPVEPEADLAPVVVRAEKVSIIFSAGRQRTVALSEVSLDIRQGEFVSLIGPSGCGKTTLLRAIADLERITAGALSVNGATPEEARRRRDYGYVFQAPALYPWRTVERNVMLPLEIMGMLRSDRRDRVKQYLDLVGLAEFRRRYPWQLSGGMQQRVSIARALSFEPSLLLMDEPFGALDEITRDGLNQHLHELWRRTGMTVVFVTHSIPEAIFLSTRVVVMSPRPGRIVDMIDVDLGVARGPDTRDGGRFIELAHRVREALKAAYSYE